MNSTLQKYKQSKKTFTLIELLSTVTVISLLAALLLPTFKKVKEEGKGTYCVSNLRQIGQGMYIYSSDNNSFIPYTDFESGEYSESTWDSKLIPYLTGQSVDNFMVSYGAGREFKPFNCPAWNEKEGSLYLYSFSVTPNRDYAANRLLTSKASVWNLAPCKIDERIEQTSDNWINWLVCEGGDRNQIGRISGGSIQGDSDYRGYWEGGSAGINGGGFHARHNRGANFLARDGSVRKVFMPN